MALHANYMGTGGSGTLDKLEEALKFAQEMAASDVVYFRDNPIAAGALTNMADRNRNQLAHEVLSRGRTVMTFASVTEELGDAGLSFAASARLQDHFDWINLSPDGQKLLVGIRHPVFRQSAIDYLVNQQARFDIFVKGLWPLTSVVRAEALHRARLRLVPL